ncbi:MAG: hypothetical protein FJ303_20035 [Planctomycetes bacterium]|nr:hypothetical protein [Planctomycetota bacterium]
MAMRSILSFALAFVLSAPAFGQATNADGRIETLVRKLASTSFVEREKARAELEAIGAPALEALRRAKTNDAEAAKRIAALIARFEEQIRTFQILAPKEISLNLAGVPVQQAISELASKSGYPVQFQGDATPFADKKITLEGKMPFWIALEKLCDQAGLMERADPNPQPNMTPSTLPGIGKKGIKRLPSVMPNAPAQAGPIVLVNRGAEKSFVSHAGAVKTELRIRRDVAAKEMTIQLIVSTEPRLLNGSVVGNAIIDKLFDGQGRALLMIVDAPKADSKKKDIFDPMLQSLDLGWIPNQRMAQIRVKDEHAAKVLKELTGKLALQLDLQNEVLAKVDNVLDAAGKSADGSNGGRLRITSVNKRPNGAVEVEVALENLTPNPFGGRIFVNGGGGVVIRGNVIVNGGGIVIGPNGVRVTGSGGDADLPDLRDAKGEKFTRTVLSESTNIANNSVSRQARLLFAPNANQAEPAALVLIGTRTHTITLPFRFENVELP